MTTAEELAAFFEANGLGTVKTTANHGTIFRNYVPDEPSDVLAILEEPGMEPNYVLNKPGILEERPRVAIITRAVNVDTARDLIEQAFLLSATIINTTLTAGGPRWLRCAPMQSPFGDGRDYNGWFRFRFTAQIVKGPSSEGS